MPYIPAAIHLTGGIIIQLIKEPGIEKCYSTLAERVGGIDFHAGTLFDQEGYKYHIFREGHEIMMNPEGGYFDRGGKALEIVPEGLQGRQNLVDWHDVSDYWDMRRSLPDAPSSGKGWLYFGASVCHGDGPFGTYSSCTKTTMVEHIVHIDGVTGSSPVATTKIPG